jgi:hypothetical protein
MPILETPPLLILGDEKEYIERVLKEYKNPILLPENKRVLFLYQTDEEWAHLWRGKDGLKPNKARMQRVLWIKFVLENKDIRIVKKRLSNKMVVFFCEELSYVVVCCELKSKELKCITQYLTEAKFKDKFNNLSEYQDYAFK